MTGKVLIGKKVVATSNTLPANVEEKGIKLSAEQYKELRDTDKIQPDVNYYVDGILYRNDIQYGSSEGGAGGYSKSEIDDLLDEKQDILFAGENISLTRRNSNDGYTIDVKNVAKTNDNTVFDQAVTCNDTLTVNTVNDRWGNKVFEVNGNGRDLYVGGPKKTLTLQSSEKNIKLSTPDGDCKVLTDENLASTSSVGAVKIGSNMKIAEDGSISPDNIVFITKEDYDELDTKDPNKLYSITDAELLVDDLNKANDENTFTGKFIKNTFQQGEATFTVSSDQDLQDWADNKAGNDYSMVYISEGTFTLPRGSINLDTTGTKSIVGHPKSLLKFEETTDTIGSGQNVYVPAIYRTSGVNDKDHYIRGVSVEAVGTPGVYGSNSTSRLACAFYGCNNMYNCSGKAHSQGNEWMAAYGFYGCNNLVLCYGTASGDKNGNAYGFSYCNYMTSCVADMTEYPTKYDDKADIYCFTSCSYCTSCYGKAKNGYEILRGFYKSNNMTSCGIECVQDNGAQTLVQTTCYEECYRITSCEGKLTTNGKEASKTGTNEFYCCSGVVNCTAPNGMRNCNKCSQNSSAKYTTCWADGANSVAVADTAAGGFNSAIVTWPK